MTAFPEGNALVYCQGAFNTTNGKTAHGLVRRTDRYRVLGIIDSRYAGQDAAQILDKRAKNIPVFADIEQAARALVETPATYFVIGLAPDGGRLSSSARRDVRDALERGWNVDCGLHDYLTDDPELTKLAREKGARIRDVRKPPPIGALHFFTGQIEEVDSLKIAVLGTDSAIGKRTTAWILVEALRAEGRSAEMIGTGQTAWMQGTRYGLILDSLVNDFVSGEIEHAVWSAWKELSPEVIVIEGQGSLMNPAYPGGFEILAAGRPDVVVMQHAPARREYDGFPGYPLHPLERQIEAVRVISDKPVVGITINHEGLAPGEIDPICDDIRRRTGLATCDPLIHGVSDILRALKITTSR